MQPKLRATFSHMKYTAFHSLLDSKQKKLTADVEQLRSVPKMMSFESLFLA